MVSRRIGWLLGVGGVAMLLISVAGIIAGATLLPLSSAATPKIWDTACLLTALVIVASVAAAKVHSKWWFCLTAAGCLTLVFILGNLFV
jgi:hypothetical protein